MYNENNVHRQLQKVMVGLFESAWGSAETPVTRDIPSGYVDPERIDTFLG